MSLEEQQAVVSRSSQEVKLCGCLGCPKPHLWFSTFCPISSLHNGLTFKGTGSYNCLNFRFKICMIVNFMHWFRGNAHIKSRNRPPLNSTPGLTLKSITSFILMWFGQCALVHLLTQQLVPEVSIVHGAADKAPYLWNHKRHSVFPLSVSLPVSFPRSLLQRICYTGYLPFQFLYEDKFHLSVCSKALLRVQAFWVQAFQVVPIPLLGLSNRSARERGR